MGFYTIYTQMFRMCIVSTIVPVYRSHLCGSNYIFQACIISDESDEAKIERKMSAFTFSYDIIPVIICLMESADICHVVSFVL